MGRHKCLLEKERKAKEKERVLARVAAVEKKEAVVDDLLPGRELLNNLNAAEREALIARAEAEIRATAPVWREMRKILPPQLENQACRISDGGGGEEWGEFWWLGRRRRPTPGPSRGGRGDVFLGWFAQGANHPAGAEGTVRMGVGVPTSPIHGAFNIRPVIYGRCTDVMARRKKDPPPAPPEAGGVDDSLGGSRKARTTRPVRAGTRPFRSGNPPAPFMGLFNSGRSFMAGARTTLWLARKTPTPPLPKREG